MRPLLGHAVQVERGVGRDQAAIQPVLGVAVETARAARLLRRARHRFRLDRARFPEILLEFFPFIFCCAPAGAADLAHQ
jgi:hypothetical protein